MCVSQEDASEMPYSRATGRSPLRGRDIQLGLGVWVCLLSGRVATEGPRVLGREAVRPVPVPVDIYCLHRAAPSF